MELRHSDATEEREFPFSFNLLQADNNEDYDTAAALAILPSVQLEHFED